MNSMTEDPYQKKADVSSLDQDLRELRRSKYDTKLADQARIWIFDRIGETDPKTDLIDTLKDGVVLGKLANAINGDKVVKYKESKMPFVQMENISQFLTFVKQYGVPEDEVFQTIDLYESNDPTIVLQTIVSFSRYVHTKTPSIPVIGPKLSTKQPPPKIPKKPQHLNDSKWSSFEYGYIGGANQSKEGVTFGTKRNITKQ